MTWKTTLWLVLLALPGVAAASWLVVPLLVDASTLPVPLEAVQLGSALQGALGVLFAAFIGAKLAPTVGLSAPVIRALASGERVTDALRPQLVPGLLGGALGALVLVAFPLLAPDALLAIQPKTAIPIAVRLLYGGITEEVLIRWGLMTALAWGIWKLFERRSPKPSSRAIGTAIVVSSVLFGLAHLPALAQPGVDLPFVVVASVTVANAVFGIVAGSLFWRYGLEAAMLAHAVAHLLAFLVHG